MCLRTLWAFIYPTNVGRLSPLLTKQKSSEKIQKGLIMDLVIDSSILFAALLKESGTSNILFKHTLYAPEFIFEEFRKYRDYLKDKTKRTEEDFNKLFDLFELNVILIPKNEIDPFIKQADKISPDAKDVPY